MLADAVRQRRGESNLGKADQSVLDRRYDGFRVGENRQEQSSGMRKYMSPVNQNGDFGADMLSTQSASVMSAS